MKKGYKVTDVRREKKIGVAAENLEELIEKSYKKLGVSCFCLCLRSQHNFQSTFSINFDYNMDCLIHKIRVISFNTGIELRIDP